MGLAQGRMGPHGVSMVPHGPAWGRMGRMGHMAWGRMGMILSSQQASDPPSRPPLGILCEIHQK
jgi:hypothetical protein